MNDYDSGSWALLEVPVVAWSDSAVFGLPFMDKNVGYLFVIICNMFFCKLL
ncbi:unnamed protein product [Haemonchus placei]|uniref:Uncharacterized protein n=1 Tax=Haemonchus placei TaxID=6290 RepID=A0A3P7VK00_HAEPC|nr:unnamed protein product [Haemonchus placei]